MKDKTIRDIRAYARKHLKSSHVEVEVARMIDWDIPYEVYRELPGHGARKKAQLLIEDVRASKIPWYKRIFGQ